MRRGTHSRSGSYESLDQYKRRRVYLTIGWICSFFWVMNLISTGSDEWKNSPLYIYAIITLAVIAFVCNEVSKWYKKAQKWDEIQEALRMEEWEKQQNNLR